jgi:DNA polymerase-3 subunit delta
MDHPACHHPPNGITNRFMDSSNPTAVDKIFNAHILILHGEEEMAIQLVLQQLIAEYTRDGMADLNLSRLDGKTVARNDLHNHLHLLPFGVEKRLVILENPLSLAKNKEEQENFIQLLDTLPPTTRLVMIILDEWIRVQKKWLWQSLKPNHWLMDWLAQNTGKAILQEFRLPGIQEMNVWIDTEVKRQGGAIENQACRELASAFGTETRLLNREIEKLLIFTERKRPITVTDVRELCVPLEREDIFAMMDAIALGDARTALRLLDISLQNQPEPVILTMIVNHFRQLIIAAEMSAEGISYSEIGHELNKPEFVAEKLVVQSRRFGIERLEEIYQRLVDLDEDIKNSRTSGDLALELFVAELAR